MSTIHCSRCRRHFAGLIAWAAHINPNGTCKNEEATRGS